MKKDSDTFGSFAKNARLKAGLGLREFAREISISAAYLSRVENDLDSPSGELIHQMARLYKIPVEDLTRRASKPNASAAAHGLTVQSSPELRALYRLGATLDVSDVEELIRHVLGQQNISVEEIEKQLASLKSKLPRISNSVRDGLFAEEAKPRFLSKHRINNMAHEMLERNGLTEDTYTPPTPIELLVENEPGVLYQIKNLKCDRFGNPVVLGLSGWHESGNRQIIINTALADSTQKTNEYRFNFTLAHELFHAIEHLPRVPKDTVPPLARMQVFVDRGWSKQRSVAERAVSRWAAKRVQPRGLTTHEDWREWQANTFASSLLMPDWSVSAQFLCRTGAEKLFIHPPQNDRDEALRLAGETVFDSEIYDQSMAELYGVSRQAMAIRLLQLRLVEEVSG